MLLTVNGEAREVEVATDAMLLDVLRDQLRLTGAKSGCGRGECGACTVLVDGLPTMSCIQLAALVEGEVTTIEGLAEQALPLREAFADCGGFQCGYCTSGQIVSAWALIQRGLPDDEAEAEAEVRTAMNGNICRCTGYAGIVAAVMKAARG